MTSREATVVVESTLLDVERGTVEGIVAGVRQAVRGTGGYRSEWPKTRKRRGVARRHKPSIATFKVKANFRRTGTTVSISNTQGHAIILERSPIIRGHRNVHYHALLRTFENNFDAIGRAAAADAQRRAAGRAIRRAKARAARGLPPG